MIYYIIKFAITTILVVAISEINKRSSFAGALLASIPLISVLAMLWLYVDTKDVSKVSVLSASIFWLVLPSLALFVTLPTLLKYGVNFYFSMAIAIAITVICYWVMVTVLSHFGLKL